MEEILVNMDEWKKFGQNLLPLLQMIDFDHVIVDMLHVLLRIGNKLLGVLIEDILTNDHWEDNIKSVFSCFLFLVFFFNKVRVLTFHNKYFSEFMDEMRRIGVKFNFFEDSDGKVKYNSLQASDLREVLSTFNLEAVIEKSRAAEAEKIWRGFLKLYDCIRYPGPTHDLEKDMKSWFDLFTKEQTLEPEEDGYLAPIFHDTDVTPYIHVFQEHCPELRKIHGPLDIFACDGLEKKGHLHQIDFFHSGMKGGGKYRIHPILTMLRKENRRTFFKKKDHIRESDTQQTVQGTKRKSRNPYNRRVVPKWNPEGR